MNNALLSIVIAVFVGLSSAACGGGGHEKGTPTPEHDDKCAAYKKKPHAYDYDSEETGMNAGCYLVWWTDGAGNERDLFCCK